ncbi:glutathione S-transferase [Erwinia toletana]|uniref:Glutathione S-transferase n=1 Tax=Winslowiella toletana TaxID=92490 RepID=A0ABS4PFR3_9GAMM|nr:hypothetical protein [Winslowiella toletana]MBP2171485.1 glutathione S-transferase [Winslowiella toletana]
MNDKQAITQLYGATGCGSAIIEIIYTLAGEPYQFIDVNGFELPERYRQQLWLWLESQITPPGPYLFGREISLLDAYLAVMIAWRPRQAWFAQHTPKIMAIARQVRELDNIKPIIDRNKL